MNHRVLRREDIKRANHEAVYRILDSFDAPATIAEIAERLPELSPRTVRRAINYMMQPNVGMIIEAGKRDGATMYAMRNKKYSATAMRDRLIPFGDSFIDVHTFIDLMVNPNGNPLKLATGGTKGNMLDVDASTNIRKRMAYIIMTSGSPGHAAQVETYAGGLRKITYELRYVLGILEAFNASHVFYDNYRDSIAYELRRMQESDPGLFELALDFIQDLVAR